MHVPEKHIPNLLLALIVVLLCLYVQESRAQDYPTELEGDFVPQVDWTDQSGRRSVLRHNQTPPIVPGGVYRYFINLRDRDNERGRRRAEEIVLNATALWSKWGNIEFESMGFVSDDNPRWVDVSNGNMTPLVDIPVGDLVKTVAAGYFTVTFMEFDTLNANRVCGPDVYCIAGRASFRTGQYNTIRAGHAINSWEVCPVVVTAHEIGHTLGFRHAVFTDNIMTTPAQCHLTDLGPEDIEAIQYVYGPADPNRANVIFSGTEFPRNPFAYTADTCIQERTGVRFVVRAGQGIYEAYDVPGILLTIPYVQLPDGTAIGGEICIDPADIVDAYELEPDHDYPRWWDTYPSN